MKAQRFNIQGMAKDLTRGKATQSFAYDMMNLRSVPVDDGTMFCLVNEKGNKEITILEEIFDKPKEKIRRISELNITHNNKTLVGIPIGYCVTMNYFVVFSHENRVAKPDHIYRIRKTKDGRFYCLEVYHGDLGFDTKNPIETQSWYESEDIEKVYWVDGKNQLRSVNVGNEGVVIQDLDTQFDTLPTLQLQENIDIRQKVDGKGIFPPGVLQYVFTYIGWNGQETNIIHHTPLYYLMNKDGGLPPQDSTTTTSICKNEFEIKIYNVDLNFRFLRIYSLIRTAEDMNPQCRLVSDLEIQDSNTNMPLVYTDTYQYGSLVEYSSILLKNDKEIIPQTMAQKDNVLFLANYKTAEDQLLSANIQQIYENPFVKDSTLEYSNGCMTYNNGKPFTSFGYNYEDIYQHESYKHFKKGNTYRLGYQLQDKFGRWGDVIRISDHVVNNDARSIVCTMSFNGNDGIENYRKIRPVIVYPNEAERYFECQGELNSTLINPGLKKIGIDVIPSWFSRPNNPISPSYENFGNQDYIESVALEGVKGLWHIRQDNSKVIFCMGAEICKANITSYGSKWMYKKAEFDDTDFFINEQVLDMYSPDIEFVDGKMLYGRTLELSYISKERFSSNYYLTAKSTFDNPANNGQYTGFYYEKRDDNGQWDNCGVTYSGPFWFDNVYMTANYLDNRSQNPESVIELYNKIRSNIYKDFLSIEGGHIISPWHKPFVNGNRFNDIGNALNATEDSGLITTKVLVNVKRFNHIRHKDYSLISKTVDLDDVQVYRKENEGSLLHLDNVCNNEIYQGKVDFNMIIDNHEVLTRESRRKKVDRFSRLSTYTTYPVENSYLINPNYQDPPCFEISEIYATENFVLVDDHPDNTSIYNDYYLDYITTNNSAPYNWSVSFYIKGNYSSIAPFTEYYNPLWGINVGAFWASNCKTEQVPININFRSNTHGVLSVAGKQNDDNTEHYYSLWSKHGWYNPDNSVDHPWFTDKTFKRINDFENPIPTGSLYFANLVNKNNTNIDFGGITDTRYYEQDWYVAGAAVDIEQADLSLIWVEGDVYYQRYDALRTYAASEEAIESIIDIDSYPVQTYINIDGRYDRNRESYTNFYLSPQNFNLINKVYSSKNDFFIYHGRNPLSTKGKQGSTVTWTLPKKTEELVDTWHNVDLLSILLLDGDKGKITALRRYGNELYAFQEHAISRIRYNINTLVSTSDNIPLEMRNSNAVEGKDYLTQTVGCQDKWTICEGSKGLYFIDGSQREIYNMSGNGIRNISDELLMSSWCNENMKGLIEWNPDDFDGMVTLYDSINDEIMFVGKEKALVLYEGPATQQSFFEGFFSYGSMPYMTNFMNDMIQIRVNGHASFTLWKRHEGEYNSFFGKQEDYWMTFIANGIDGNNGNELGTDKNFEYIEYRADKFSFENGTNNWTQCEHNKLPFTWMEVKNEHQTASQQLMQSVARSNTHKKFRIWRTLFPRPAQGYGVMQQRIRNPWCSITLKNVTDKNDNYKNVINDLVVYYN